MSIGNWEWALGIGHWALSPSSPTLREAKATSTPVFFFNFELISPPFPTPHSRNLKGNYQIIILKLCSSNGSATQSRG
ncbi:MAG: hypothetical protein ACYT04_83400, partial [Nostoc sp.]